MDQQKIGEFLKTLRKEKDLTQEELADKMNVSRRTVSRWETGSNLPDLSILVELADLYDVDLREIFDGERKSETMDKDLKETMLKAADYTDHLCDCMRRTLYSRSILRTGDGISPLFLCRRCSAWNNVRCTDPRNNHYRKEFQEVCRMEAFQTRQFKRLTADPQGETT